MKTFEEFVVEVSDKTAMDLANGRVKQLHTTFNDADRPAAKEKVRKTFDALRTRASRQRKLAGLDKEEQK